MVPGLPSAGPPPIFPETENLNRENLNLHAFSKNPKFKPAQPPFAGLNFGPISRGLNLIPPGIKKKGMLRMFHTRTFCLHLLFEMLKRAIR